MTMAAADPAFAASHNDGHPAIAATSRPADFTKAADKCRPLPAGTAAHADQPAATEHAAEHARNLRVSSAAPARIRR